MFRPAILPLSEEIINVQHDQGDLIKQHHKNLAGFDFQRRKWKKAKGKWTKKEKEKKEQVNEDRTDTRQKG